MTSSPETFGFVGAGRVASALAVALARAQKRVSAVCSRGGESAEALARRVPGCTAVADAQAVADASSVVFLAVPDDAVPTVAQDVRWRTDQAVVHCSGALGLDVFASARAAGARVGSFHPLQTFPRSTACSSLDVVAFAIDGDGILATRLDALARELGGRPFHVPPDGRALYHASATLACGSVVTLLDEAAGVWESFGYPRRQALDYLLPLLRSTVDMLDALGPEEALTGPIARGDVDTVRRHLAALDQAAPETATLYRALALRTVPLATRKGTLTTERATELRQALAERHGGDQACE